MSTNGSSDWHAAAAVWREATAAGVPVTGAQLGQHVGRSPSWGRGVKRELEAAAARAAAAESDTPPAAATAERQAAPPLRQGRSWRDWTNEAFVVAVVAAFGSFGHMYTVALTAGEPLWIARAWPITVDGLILAALRRGEEGRPWLVLGLAVSVAANIVSHFPDVAADAGPLVAAWPPVALYGTHRLLHPRSVPQEPPASLSDAGG